MCRPLPVPVHVPRRCGRRLATCLHITTFLLLLRVMVPDPAAAQLATTGRWSQPSPSVLSSNGNLTATGIHMAWLRGDDGWEGNPNLFHSYLYWWNARDEFCINPNATDPNVNPKFKGALYGWRPGSNVANTGTMMQSGFTRIQLDDAVLDPGGELNGHDIFCSGHTLMHDGRLMVAGGAEAENTGSFKSAIFDPHVTSGSRWTHLGNMSIPRWYPTLVQTAGKDVFSYAGLQYARMHVLFGKAASGGEPRWLMGRHRVTSSGYWDADVLPAEDTGATAGNPDGTRPRPRYYAGGGTYRVPGTALTRTVMFGGRDSTQGWSGAGGTAVRSDVWWLEHNGNEGADDLKWMRFNSYSGDNQPSDGLWKHASIVNENTAELWVWGGLDGNGGLNGAVYRGMVDPGVTSGRGWKWERHDLTNGPTARQLASAAYDEKYNRMVVYGGYTDAAGNTVTSDDDVYALSLGSNPTWQKLTFTAANPASPERPVALAEAALAAGPDGGEHLDGPKANMYLYGGASSAGLKGEVWLMYFPDPTHVSWVKLNVDANSGGPGLRRGATAIRDHDSWNLRVFGGVGPANTQTDGKVYRIDIYRDGNNTMCDQLARPWVAQVGPAYAAGGTTGSMVMFDPYELSATSVEVRHPNAAANSSWETASTQGRFQHFYPLLFPLPDGSVFDATARLGGRPTYKFVPATGQWSEIPAGWVPSGSPLADLEGGSAVMRRLVDGTYDIMKCGTKDTEGPLTIGTTGRLRLEANGAAPTGWALSDSMHRRVFHNLVILPDGKVLVTGGLSTNKQGLDTDTPFAVRRPQIWNPAGTGSWTGATVLAEEPLLRGYHAAALVMPDGRTLTGGGNDPGSSDLDKHKFAVYAPPQWFDENGNHATTVSAVTLPNQVAYGASARINLNISAPVEKLVLLRPGAVTHGFNSSQVYSELAFSPCPNGDGSQLTITAPPANSIPPGDYLLFAVAAGHWSTGQWLRLDTGLSTTYAGSPLGECPAGGCIPTPEDPFCTGGDGGGGFYEGGTSVRRDPGAFSVRPGETISPTWVTNTLFAGVADGDVADDRLRLQPGPLQDGVVSRVRLSHRGGGSDTYSSVRLVAVDHADGEEALAMQAGIVVGTRGAAGSVHDASGADVSAAVSSSEGLQLSLGEVIEVALPASAGDGALWLATSGHPANDGGIRLEEQTAAGWREVAVHTPRARRDMQVVSGLTSNTIRLVALGRHRLHGIGRFTPGNSPTSTVLTAAAVRHSATGEVATADPFTLTDGDSAWVDFVTPEPPASGTREWFLEVTGTPQGYQPSAGALHARHAPAEEPGNSIAKFRLAGGIPNPFNASTRVLFELPRPQTVRLEVFDMQGRLVRMVESRFEAGVHSLVWDRRTTGGALAPRGVYPIRVTAGDERANGRLTVR